MKIRSVHFFINQTYCDIIEISKIYPKNAMFTLNSLTKAMIFGADVIVAVIVALTLKFRLE